MNSKEKNKRFWLSLDDLKNSLSFAKAKENEFAEGMTDNFNPEDMPSHSRRKFLALAGASAAFAATACTNYRDKGEIIPYNKKPDDLTIGTASYYASTCTGCSNGCGILIKTREGRPIKIDGNPDHPVNKGKICAAGQANILNLYDPERLKEPHSGANGKFKFDNWKNIDNKINVALNNASANNKEIAIITHSVLSPTQKKLFDDFKIKYPTTKIYSYELFDDRTRQSAWKQCYGESEFPVINWGDANVILSLESDILGKEGNFVEQIRLFAAKRNVDDAKNFNRLYVAEGGMSLTGMNSDHRLRIKPDAQFEFVMCLLNEILNVRKAGTISFGPLAKSKIEQYLLNEFAQKEKLSMSVLNSLVNDLISNKGKSIIYAGDILAEKVHVAVNLLNEVFGNNTLYNKERSSVKHLDLSANEEIEQLIGSMYSGNVGVVIHFDTNPVYHFAPDYGYSTALNKVPVVVTMCEHENETSLKSHFALPVHHNFESWGDFQTRTGLYSLQQPVIAPLYNTRQKESVLLHWLSGSVENYSEDGYHQYLMKNWEQYIYPQLSVASDFRTFWFAALNDGVVNYKSVVQGIGLFNYNKIENLIYSYWQPAYQHGKSNFTSPVISVVTAESDASKKSEFSESLGLVLMLTGNYTIGDGRFANNGWLQELPHPVSKVTWDNYAAISLNTSKQLNVKIGDNVDINANGKKMTIPVMIQPGMADNLVSIELGYGRKSAGTVGSNVGFDGIQFLSKKNSSAKLLKDFTLSKGSGKYKFASTQEHHAINEPEVMDYHKKRHIVQEGTVAAFIKNPDFFRESKPKAEDISIMNRVQYKGTKWAMAIDLNKCVGCGICVTACNVENNVPVVGKDQVMVGREMHWIRIDRYYSDSPVEPETSNQPILCMHCDDAPCENVCPVVATNHSPDGLNQMVYNRCVGTRYCSNNCPYKVRRFNFYNFRNHFEDGYYHKDSLSLMHNPEVTVRSRGVMEKCTFCVQRIMEARQEAIKNGVPLKGTDVKTACQEACPADAITFGDAHEKDSQIDYIRNHKLGYHVLEELNIKPNVTYIARLRNKATEVKS
ncbi:MAG: 4Fe-4S dicluster domain-containing protein [Bacteroidetes bacterium]|nr:MAG: 4Fe-4S dicluster domain-containing protein [Bacteroidota bacterium]